ncbi:MAG: formimidoylglutamase [Bacteroidetes bacterium]|nr:formimidoylglutamase [Bacteroidota bacterium]
MSLSENFIPIHVEDELNVKNYSSDCWINSVAIHEKLFPILDGKKIALIGIISEDSNFEANHIRSHLYSMTKLEYASVFADLGNFMFDHQDGKIQEKLGFTLSELITSGLIPLLIGNSQELTYAQYLAYEYLEKYVNIINVDSRIDLNLDDSGELHEDNYLSKILVKEPPFLFNLCQLAFQSHQTDNRILKLLENYHFDLIRLGKIRDSFDEIEPIVRSGDLLSFDISAIRQADSSGCNFPSPSGLFAEEACRIARIAGMSNNLSSAAIYEYNSQKDKRSQTAQLIAQMIWYFTDGVYHRITEGKFNDSSTFVKYISTDQSNIHEMVFYKSKKSNRWWMEVPVSHKKKNYIGKELFPCSYKDYELSTKGEIPERWWKALKKLS